MKNKFLSAASIFTAMILMTACGTPIAYRSYEGAQRPVNEIAVLSVDRLIFVTSVDDKLTGINTYQVGQKGVDLEIAPGSHKIQFIYSSMIQTTSYISTRHSQPIDATYEFKAGRKYELHYSDNGKTFDYKIVDVTDGGTKKGMLATWGRQ